MYSISPLIITDLCITWAVFTYGHEEIVYVCNGLAELEVQPLIDEKATIHEALVCTSDSVHHERNLGGDSLLDPARGRGVGHIDEQNGAYRPTASSVKIKVTGDCGFGVAGRISIHQSNHCALFSVHTL